MDFYAFLGLLGWFCGVEKEYAFWSASVDFHPFLGLFEVCGAEKGHAFWSIPFLGFLERPRRGKGQAVQRFQDRDKENCCLI